MAPAAVKKLEQERAIPLLVDLVYLSSGSSALMPALMLLESLGISTRSDIMSSGTYIKMQGLSCYADLVDEEFGGHALGITRTLLGAV
jgi:hypothetical protein